MNADEQKALQEQLIAENRSESEDIKVIAKSVMGIEAIMSGKRAQLQNEAARTNIMPGVINGMSSYDMALDFLTKEINPKLMDAATNIQLVSESLGTFTAVTANKAFLTGPISTFAAKNPEEFGQAWNDYIHEMFGDSEWVDNFGAKVQEATTSVANFATGLNQYLTDHGLDLMPGNKNNAAFSGRDGSTSTPLARSPQDDQATVLATMTDAVTEASHRALNGGRPDYVLPIVNSNGFLNNSVTFSGTQNSLPGASVAPTGGGAQTGTQGSQTGGAESRQVGPYDFNISGNLTMTVTGDNGKIGTEEIIKRLLNDTDFKRMLAHEIAISKAQIESGHNPTAN